MDEMKVKKAADEMHSMNPHGILKQLPETYYELTRGERGEAIRLFKRMAYPGRPYDETK